MGAHPGTLTILTRYSLFAIIALERGSWERPGCRAWERYCVGRLTIWRWRTAPRRRAGEAVQRHSDRLLSCGHPPRPRWRPVRRRIRRWTAHRSRTGADRSEPREGKRRIVPNTSPAHSRGCARARYRKNCQKPNDRLFSSILDLCRRTHGRGCARTTTQVPQSVTPQQTLLPNARRLMPFGNMSRVFVTSLDQPACTRSSSRTRSSWLSALRIRWRVWDSSPARR